MRPRRCALALLALALIAACTDREAPTASGPRVPTAPPVLRNGAGSVDVIQISVGLQVVCALKVDYTVACWGPSAGTVPALRPVVRVAAGAYHVCVLQDDLSTVCWGSNANGEASPPTTSFTFLDAEWRRSCGIGTAGAIDCWGYDGHDYLDPPGGAFTALDLGDFHGCGLRTDGAAICWGSNSYGNADDRTGPFIQLSSGGSSNCGVLGSGALSCWGYGDDGQTSPPPGSYIQVSMGVRHGCALTTGLSLTCWGQNLYGQAAPPPGSFTQVSSGPYVSCAITSQARVVCWGFSAYVNGIPPEIAGPSLTTTALASSPNPSGFGQSVTFTATVTPASGTGTASGGSVTFIEGGTCTSPTTTLAANVALGAGGQASFSTSALALGAHTVIACYSGSTGFLGSQGSATHTVDPGITGTAVTVNPTTQQYSDRVTLQATVTPASANGSSPTGTVQFSIGGVNVGSPVALGAGGIATLSDAQVPVGQGTKTVQAAFSSTNTNFQGSSGTTNLTVTREDASVIFDFGNPVALQVGTPGGTLSGSALSFLVAVREAINDVAVSPGTTGQGNIANTGLTVSLIPVAPGTTIPLSCTGGTVPGNGQGVSRHFTCTTSSAIPVNVYEVRATVTGDHFTGSASDAFTVFDPSLGFVTGGGTFAIGGDRVRFGINTKYKKKGDAPKGDLIVVRRHADGTSSTLAANALAGLAVGEDPAVPMGWAALNGRATYTRWDATAGAYVTNGGQPFTFYVEDSGDPGTGTDRVWVGGPPLLSLPGTPSTARANAVTLTGGNVSVPHGAK